MTAEKAEARPARPGAEDASACPRCGQPGLMTARYPHAWHGQAGKRIRGFKEVILCAGCEGGEAAGALLALVDVHGQVCPEDTAAFLRLALDWVETARRQELDVAALAREEQRWHSGEL
ncbi:hypothetical protein HEK616_80350 (plasmid) [Streptomyces nigrescens]|uniref:Restriction alleviation protein, Lar family n=1 Tax=Streptomyces nigrescens TaxID=1920 RepID=A0ABM8A7C5_STRNI|nr:DUF6300 family protein [Streptomyces nigrescens]BDM74548.1 hypothetical protein HEK616_80350 [Streptomyces nigrescens]